MGHGESSASRSTSKHQLENDRFIHKSAWFDDGYRYRQVKPIDLPDYGEANLLWAALAEKALAQVNETGLLRRASWENSYAAIEGGWSKGIDFVTGEVASDSFIDSSDTITMNLRPSIQKLTHYCLFLLEMDWFEQPQSR